MNRQQAEHILSGYLRIWSNPNMEDAAESLREIILDAMTEYRTSGSSANSYGITWPNIVVPTTSKLPDTAYNPTAYKPIVTCGGES